MDLTKKKTYFKLFISVFIILELVRMRTVKLTIFVLLLILISNPTGRGELTPNMISYYYMTDSIENGVWNPDKVFTDDSMVKAREGDRIDVEIDYIDGTEFTYNISANWVWSFAKEDITNFGGWVISDDFDYWMEDGNVNAKDRFLDGFEDLRIELTEDISIKTNGDLLYEMRLRAIDEFNDSALDVTYYAKYHENGRLSLLNYEVWVKILNTRYIRDSINLRNTGTDFALDVFQEKSPGFLILSVFALIPVVLIKRKNID